MLTTEPTGREIAGKLSPAMPCDDVQLRHGVGDKFHFLPGKALLRAAQRYGPPALAGGGTAVGQTAALRLFSGRAVGAQQSAAQFRSLSREVCI